MKKVIHSAFVASGSGDRVIRCFVLESLIPRFPKSKTISQLQEELTTYGFTCSKKTIYRDLDLLSCVKPVLCEEESRPRGYSMQAEG